MANILSYFIYNVPDINKSKFSYGALNNSINIYYNSEVIFSIDFYENYKYISNFSKNISRTFNDNILVNFSTYEYQKDLDLSISNSNIVKQYFTIYIYKDNKIWTEENDNYLCIYSNILNSIKDKYCYIYEITDIKLFYTKNQRLNNYFIYIYKKHNMIFTIKYNKSFILIPNKYELNYYSMYFHLI